jgi:hypothetical protein
MSYDELIAIVDACLDEMWTLLPVEAVERISLRVVRLDRPERISVLEAILEEAEADYFWPILLEMVDGLRVSAHLEKSSQPPATRA